MTEVIALAVPSFLAGVLTFLAPCTLPLVPAYLGFISGGADRSADVPSQPRRWRVVGNGVAFVLGFSLVFVSFGVLAGLAGTALSPVRSTLTQLGGILIVLFGLFLLGVLRLPLAQRTVRLTPPSWLQPGHRHASFLVGVAFAAGWSPCVGPIVGSILLLVASNATVAQGTLLLAIFSLGLAIPFLLVAYGVQQSLPTLRRLHGILPLIEKIGGLFLIILGALVLTNRLPLLISWGFQLLGNLGYESILEYL
ncbi:sulfite exporter TauE/SafE family protein [Candidatus Berkelbacteria bacterium]|nr:sulfite exporter TauE/SafE family protein [Candidatus Berkelbacteria bacterium]